MSPWLYFALPVAIILAMLQAVFFSYVPVLGVTIQVLPAFVIAWALLRGRGSADTVIFAFCAGILVDLLSIGPLGLTAISLMIAVVALFPIQANVETSRVILPIMLAGVAMLTFLLANLLMLQLGNYDISWNTIRIIPQTVIVHALFILPVYWLVTFISRLIGFQRLLEI